MTTNSLLFGPFLAPFWPLFGPFLVFSFSLTKDGFNDSAHGAKSMTSIRHYQPYDHGDNWSPLVHSREGEAQATGGQQGATGGWERGGQIRPTALARQEGQRREEEEQHDEEESNVFTRERESKRHGWIEEIEWVDRWRDRLMDRLMDQANQLHVDVVIVKQERMKQCMTI